ncbi:MAG: ATP-dependent DNA ligase, partial [Ginsengibacter sp.]
FDLLWCDGYDLKKLPLTDRKDVLKEIIPSNGIIKISESFDDGIGLFNTAENLGLEGIVAKKRDSIYTPGKKGNAWYKAKHSKRQEYVIGGWTESDNGRLFRSLIFGHYVDGKFTYVHHSGGGFTDNQMKKLSSKLKKLEVYESPFVNKVNIIAKKHWVKPQLVAEFAKSVQTTKSGTIRHPAIFIGLREDKKATEVVEEVPKKVKNENYKNKVDTQNSESKEPQKDVNAEPPGSWETLKKRKITSENKLEIEGHQMNLINIERELWPGITKAELIEYYISIADYILPHLKDRPLGLNICLQSAANGGFFLRGMEGQAPSWATIFSTERKHKKKGKSNTIEWLVCNDTATLVYIVNLESIDIHPWTSRVVSPNKTDYIVIDLDPSDDDFQKVIDTALAAKEIFGKYKLKSFIKTSGKTGLHLLIPCIDIEFGDSRKIAIKICNEIHEQVPQITTTSFSTNSRGNKVYIDPSQNDYADRIAAPYCVRAYHLPTISTPLDWTEITSKLNPSAFTIKTIFNRLEGKGDLFKNILDDKIRIHNSKILNQFL